MDVLLRIDNKSTQLRKKLVSSAIDAYIGTDISDNKINRLYIEFGRLINEALRVRRRWRSRQRNRGSEQEDDSSVDRDQSSPLPAHIDDIKSLMGTGERLGTNLVQLSDTRQYAKAQAECLKMCRTIDIYALGRK